MTYSPFDHYARKAQQENFAARSIYKLEEIVVYLPKLILPKLTNINNKEAKLMVWGGASWRTFSGFSAFIA